MNVAAHQYFISTLNDAAKSGISWTKRSRLVEGIVSELIQCGKDGSEKIIIETDGLEINVETSPLTLKVTGKVTNDHLTISVVDGQTLLNNLTCDLQTINTALAQLILRNRHDIKPKALI